MAAELDFRDAKSAARKLGIPGDTVTDLLESGRLPGIQLGDTWLVSERALADFLRSEQERQVASRRQTTGRGAPRSRRRRQSGAAEFTLLGQRGRAATNADLLVAVLRLLAARDPRFLTMFSSEGGRTRRYVAKDPVDLYPGRPDLSRFSKEIAPGWWVGTNYSAKETESILKKACRVAGVEWGVDLRLPKRGHRPDRARALAFVGIAADKATDVARRHDEYFAESLTNGES